MLKDKLNLLKKRPSKIVCEVYSFIITGKYLWEDQISGAGNVRQSLFGIYFVSSGRE